jgi:ribonuclease BN (tRNA processing enzyme)
MKLSSRVVDTSGAATAEAGLRVTVLGTSPVRPNAGGACSGYLVEWDGTRVLLDCGSGVLARMLRLARIDEIEAVIVSHAHPDHCLDLIALRYGAVYGPEPLSRLPRLLVGPGVRDVLHALGEALAPGSDFWGVFELSEYDPETPLAIGGATLRFAPTRHYVPCWAVRFEWRGRTFVYTADTGPSEDVARLAEGANLLLCECSLPRRQGFEHEWGHLAPHEAHEMAARAGASSLLLTHVWSEHLAGLSELIDTLEAPRAALAQEMETYELN